ncbi:MAG TPA: phosphatase PAP2 family protein [Methylomirabilota bacterium]|nr:phosphatase PAP2 family protein [Methylomirabilota bacterium]
MKTRMRAALLLTLILTSTQTFASDPDRLLSQRGSGFEMEELLSSRLRLPPDYFHPAPLPGRRWTISAVRRWNQIAVDASGYDHAGAREQLGPGRSSRAMAIVHLAIFDALNSVTRNYESYANFRVPTGPVSLDAAVAKAAHDTLVVLFPAQAANFDAWLAVDLAQIRNKKAKANGVLVGKRAAEAILALRANDGSQHAEPQVGVDWITSDAPGHWRQDPISQIPLALGAHWDTCAPFVVESASQFRAQPPPALNSRAYAIAYNEVKRLGGDGVTTPTERTMDQTIAGIYWAYDGVPNLCAPPRLYNQIAVHIADQMGTDDLNTARLLALVNVAMADATLTCWESKYYYDVWRPVTGIRESDAGTGPSGLGDGNPATVGDPAFSPLGAPASNLMGPNFTPPFPAYPSGHATMGGALFQVLRRFYWTDRIPFTFVSDELNGVTRDNEGNVRPLVPRTFRSLSEAEEENGQSRIYLGIHWAFDKTEGIAMGRRVANHVVGHLYRPANRGRH